MIGKLKGIIEEIRENSVIIDVNGVGYLVFCPVRILQNLPQEGEQVSLMIETHVREDHIHLYGFLQVEEQECFLLLNKVNGVGTKMALAILSILSPEQIATAIVTQDKTAFTQISGVGPKLATRLVNELKDKAPSISLGNAASEKKSLSSGIDINSISTNQDAVSALVNLGYSQSEAYIVVNRIASESGNTNISDLIRLSLRELSI